MSGSGSSIGERLCARIRHVLRLGGAGDIEVVEFIGQREDSACGLNGELKLLLKNHGRRLLQNAANPRLGLVSLVGPRPFWSTARVNRGTGRPARSNTKLTSAAVSEDRCARRIWPQKSSGKTSAAKIALRWIRLTGPLPATGASAQCECGISQSPAHPPRRASRVGHRAREGASP